jgi:hypothetical protein
MSETFSPMSPPGALAYVVGIDIGMESCLMCCLTMEKRQVIKPSQFNNDAQGFEWLFKHLEQLKGCVRTESTGSNKTCEAFLPPSFSLLGHQRHSLQSFQSVAEHMALLGKGNLLLDGATDSKELAHFLEGPAKACCPGHTSKPTHGVIALFDAVMVLFQSIIEIAVATVNSFTPQRLTDRTRVAIMPIGRHALRCMTHHVDSLLEKTLGRLHVEREARYRVNEIAISIHGTIQITPFAMNTHIRLIHVPGPACLTTSLVPQLIC